MKTAKFDPPIIIDINIRVDMAGGHDASRALAALNTIHDRPGGVPLDEKGTAAHVEATHALFRGRIVRLLVTEIDEAGGVTIRLEGPEPTAEALALAVRAERDRLIRVAETTTVSGGAKDPEVMRLAILTRMRANP